MKAKSECLSLHSCERRPMGYLEMSEGERLLETLHPSQIFTELAP